MVVSIQAGKISSVTLLRRLSTYSRRNNFYKAFREVGRVIRTVKHLLVGVHGRVDYADSVVT